MKNGCAMMGLREDEIELELGMSIGRSFRKAEKLKPIKNPNGNDSNTGGFPADLDPQTKREIQMLRRQEAKKKQQQKRALNRGTQNGEIQSKENSPDPDEKECKKSRGDGSGSKLKKVNLNLAIEQSGNHDDAVPNPAMYPVIPVSVPYLYPFQQLQYVPYANGFAYPCLNGAPCWGGDTGDKNPGNVVQPQTNRGFRPFQAGQNSNVKAGNTCVSDQNSSKDEKNRKSGSNGSPMCSSSVVSDLHSSSNQGGYSSENGTHSSHCQQEGPEHQMKNGSMASNLRGQSEQSATSHPMDSDQSIDISGKGIEKTASVNESNLSKPKGDAALETRPNINGEPVFSAENSTASPAKDTKKDMGKPPKPQAPHPDGALNFLHMPCVSTTGNGPNGKTINGFLYKYTKTEVSIICVCHGSSFSPAEFVQHAGGTDVSHPLKHITVIPSAF
ncbi:hypothetical protein SLEP1_g595 [Rubroshorea leprosula]|uniref:Ninja-family protein n=1 Tax=Rubroshorea leprosula TaxID=152421 RepID=A0AAV5HFR4_9ROSI|nr:hypothetical protein SLEP1_g595 [Rubroshorea leprosula]